MTTKLEAVRNRSLPALSFSVKHSDCAIGGAGDGTVKLAGQSVFNVPADRFPQTLFRTTWTMP